jgi:hypothetical protein
MIKILRATPLDGYKIRLEFSDGSSGEYDLAELIARDTEMVRPLADRDYFAACFLELGALCWRNGFELSAPGLHRKLAERGQLRRASAA